MSLLRCVASRRALRRLNTPLTHAYHPTHLSQSATRTRCFSNTPLTLYPRKDTQDKDSLDPSPSEYSKSGSDSATAGTDAAFDPNETRPEKEEQKAGQESGDGDKNSLNVSPSNPEVSQARGSEEGGSEHSPRTSSSGGGSAPKAGGGKSG